MTYQLTWLASVLRDAGLNVIEEPGWQSRGHGPMELPLRGIVCHHTATPTFSGDLPSLGELIHGRPGVTGPLCNLALGRSGKWYVIAAGYANHAGIGAYRGWGRNRANEEAIGIEAENTGYTKGPLADPWPQVQMNSYAKGCAALLTFLKLTPNACIGHKEWTSRKVDPSFDMPTFRKQIAKLMVPANGGRGKA